MFFVPNIISNNIFNIDYSMLRESGIQNLMFDLDDTIVPMGVYKDFEQRINVIDFFNNLSQYFNIIIVTRAGYFEPNFLTDFLTKILIKSEDDPEKLKNGKDSFSIIKDTLQVSKMYLNTNKFKKSVYRIILNECSFDTGKTIMIGNYPEDIVVPNIMKIKTASVYRAPTLNEPVKIKQIVLRKIN